MCRRRRLAADLRAWLNSEPVTARSSTIAQVMTRLFRESHHAAILENWGLLWMWHSLVVLLLCLITNGMQLNGVSARWPFVTLWVVGLGLWALIFWNLRHRAGPITAVERQIAHLWGGSMIASSMLFGVESIMGLRVLEFSPGAGSDRGDGVSGEGRDSVGAVLCGIAADVWDIAADGSDCGIGSSGRECVAVWCDVGSDLFCAGTEVLSAAAAWSSLTASRCGKAQVWPQELRRWIARENRAEKSRSATEHWQLKIEISLAHNGGEGPG